MMSRSTTRHGAYLGAAVCILGLSPAAPGWANVRILFKEAVRHASAVVLARPTDSSDQHLTFSVLETLCGKAPGSEIQVRRDVWEYRRPRLRESESTRATYLLLLDSDSTLLCGQLKGLLILGDSCEGILPIHDGVLRKDYREPYDGTAQADIGLNELRAQLRKEHERRSK